MIVQSLKDTRNAIDTAAKICLFGVGPLLKECYGQVVACLGREPDILCDNAQEKWGTVFFGRKCVSPAQLEELHDRMAVIITVRRYESIYLQLRRMGIRDIFVACYDNGYYAMQGINRLEDEHLAAGDQEPPTVDLQGKWTLVTGASRGVGRQIAEAMAKLGSNIIAHSRSTSHAREIVDICSSSGVQIIPVAAELGNSKELDAMFSDLERLVPQIDIVFNNAAISPPCPAGFWSVADDVYRECFAVNTIAPIRICQRLIPPMMQRGFGRVINVNTHIQMRPGEMAYACSKAALDKFVYDLAPSLDGTGVMLTLVDPGWVRTDVNGHNAPYPVESVIPGILLGALLDGDINGRRFSAQDYSGLSMEAAVRKARLHIHTFSAGRWV